MVLPSLRHLLGPFLVAIAGCALPDTTFEDKACDPTHVCPDELSCIGGRCRSVLDLGATVWSDTSPFNVPIDANPTIAASSASIMAKVQSLKGPTAGLQLNREAFTPIVAYATASSPRGTVQSTNGWLMEDVPMPADATTDGDAAGHLVIVDRDANRVWNMGGATRAGTTITAFGFAPFRADGSGFWDPTTSIGSGVASNASYLGGLIFPEELAAGYIPHALAIEVDASIIGNAPVAPALTAASGVGTASGVPIGSLLQLDPAYDISALSTEAQTIARAWQTFGAYVVDRGAGIAMLFRSTHNLPSDPYVGMELDTGGIDGELLRHMRVIAPRPASAYDSADSYTPATPHQ